jgi:hypothetical protein
VTSSLPPYSNESKTKPCKIQTTAGRSLGGVRRHLPCCRGPGQLGYRTADSNVVRIPQQAFLESAELGVCSCVDHAVLDDGCSRVVSVEEGGIPSKAGVWVVLASTRLEHDLVLDILWAGTTWVGFRRDRPAVARDRFNLRRISKTVRSGSTPADSLPWVG